MKAYYWVGRKMVGPYDHLAEYVSDLYWNEDRCRYDAMNKAFNSPEPYCWYRIFEVEVGERKLIWKGEYSQWPAGGSMNWWDEEFERKNESEVAV